MRVLPPLLVLALATVVADGQAPAPTDSAAAASRASTRARAMAAAGDAALTAPTLPGAILPHQRIIAYYGNPLSRRMGVLGEYPPDLMLAMLDEEVATWEAADPDTPVMPALHLIAVVAREAAGPDSMYRGRMADTLIERVAQWAETRNALVFLDVQVGLSTLQQELPRLSRFLARPNFHLGIDPEFSMKEGGLPGKRIGTYDAEDINYAVRFLSELAREHNVPPKILVIHRFTRRGVTNADRIRLDPHVQIVMHMDGFGTPVLKRSTWRAHIQTEPVQFTGWKQFYKARNDDPRTTLAEILALRPKVLYVQYQ